MRLLACFFAHGCRKIAKKHPNSRIFLKYGIKNPLSGINRLMGQAIIKTRNYLT